MRVADDVRTRTAVVCVLVWWVWGVLTPSVSSNTPFLLRRSVGSFICEFVLYTVGLVSAWAAFDTDERAEMWVNGACVLFFAGLVCYWFLYLLDVVR